MAVSKHQNERPAIISLIDLANALEAATQGQSAQISNLQGALASEITSRSNADILLGNLIQEEVTERESDVASLEDAISDVTDLIGSDFDESYTVSYFANLSLSAINDLQMSVAQMNELMRFGFGAETSVQGNDYYDGTFTYPIPYPSNSSSIVFPAFLSGVDQTDLEVTVSECTYQGFSYTVINRSETAKSFVVGYLALGFSAIS